MNDYIVLISEDGQPYISHHGIKGQKWGLRRYQNPDGSLTSEGQKRYNQKGAKGIKGFDEDAYNQHLKREAQKRLEKPSSAIDKDMETAFKKMRENSKTDEDKERKVSAWERARDTNRWSIDFLESVQNSKMLRDGDVKAMLVEYSKYLDHPYEYMENEGWKLPG